MPRAPRFVPRAADLMIPLLITGKPPKNALPKLRAAIRGRGPAIEWVDKTGTREASYYTSRLSRGVPVSLRSSNARRKPAMPGGPYPIDERYQKRMAARRKRMTAAQKKKFLADAKAAGWELVAYEDGLPLRSWCYDCEAHRREGHEHRTPARIADPGWGRAFREANPDLAPEAA